MNVSVIGAILACTALVTPVDATVQTGLPSIFLANGHSTILTMAKYSQLKSGMKYSHVCKTIGAVGEETSRTDMAGYVTVMYIWSNDNGSNMTAMFQNGKLVSKAQFGFK